MKVLKCRRGKSLAALLESSKERAKLLKEGFSGKEIEALYSILNSFEIVSVNWQTAEGV